MSRKIAILTQPLGANYGGIIQNYALQEVLKQLGHKPITIDRRYNRHQSDLRRFLGNIKNHSLRKFLGKNIIPQNERRKFYVHTERFIQEYVEMSETIDNNEKMIDYFKNHEFNAVIVGSDQTWRPKYSPNIYNYYLDFLEEDSNVKKLAYASSFGTEVWEYTEEETERCKVLIKMFDAVSVREDSGVHLCETYLKKKAEHLLDPTLLLTAENYNSLINRPKEVKGLFTYVLDATGENEKIIARAGELLRLKVHTNQGIAFNPKEKRNLNDYILPPLEGWLQGFRDAEFVITDSFHGTIFSIINKKPFISIVNKKRGASRFESLLKQIGLEDRLVYKMDDFDERLLTKKIDYEEVHKEIEFLKGKAIDFLKDNIG